jgi:regulator of sigma E protease
MTWLYVILGLLFLVFVHELGHFVVARLVGARATRFLVGFPPVALSFRRGETEYGLGLIPLGGYVRIVGMNRPQKGDEIVLQDALEEAELRRPEGQRDLLGPAIAELRGALILDASPAAQGAAQRALLALEAEQDRLHPKTYQQAKKDLTRLADDLDPRAYWRLPVWRRIAIVAAGPAANVAAALVCLTLFFWSGVPMLETTTTVQSVSGAPAAAAGLEAGDRITAVNGTPVDGDWQAVSQAVQDSKGGLVTLQVERDGQPVTLDPVRPEASDGRWLLGFTFLQQSAGTERESVPQAAGSAATWTWVITRESLVGLKNIVATSDGHEQVSSIVGITAASEESVRSGSFLWTLGVVSLALAIFNLLPFLPLDGGHILMALIEKVRRGRPVSRVTIERVSIVGIAVMLVLFAIGLNNDIGRFGGP